MSSEGMIPGEVQEVLDDFANIFKEPTDLPPPRA